MKLVNPETLPDRLFIDSICDRLREIAVNPWPITSNDAQWVMKAVEALQQFRNLVKDG